MIHSAKLGVLFHENKKNGNARLAKPCTSIMLYDLKNL
jgi:hypothetical protein